MRSDFSLNTHHTNTRSQTRITAKSSFCTESALSNPSEIAHKVDEVCMYVCMYGNKHLEQRVWINPASKVSNPARGRS